MRLLPAGCGRRFGADIAPSAVLPVIGTKELVAWLPTLLGAGIVGFPELAYPTYDVGARIAGADSLPVDADARAQARPGSTCCG